MKVIKFVQENCTPCKMLDQMLTNMEQSVDKVIVIKESNREEIKAKYNVMSTPTMIAFDGETEVTRVSSVGFGKISSFFEEVGR
jgi:thiol-disulfide isomerase/thioredoxin